MNFTIYPGLLLRSPAMSHQQYALHGLTEACASPRFRLAILLASRTFYEELEKRGFDPERMDKRQKISLLKYLNRMCFRATPFALFASFTAISWDEEVRPVRLSEETTLIHIEPSRYVDLRLAGLLAREHDHNDLLELNGSLYRTDSEFRYYSSSRIPGSLRPEFTLESLEVTPVLNALVKLLAKPIPRYGLKSWLLERADCSDGGAESFIDDLLERRFLVSDLDPGITGEGQALQLLKLFRSTGVTRSSITKVNEIMERLVKSRPEAGNLLVADSMVRSLLNEEQLPGLCYTVMERCPIEEGGPSALHRQKLSRGLECLAQLWVPPVKQSALEVFKEAFVRKFDREVVPILRALDPQFGVAYGSTAATGDFLETVVFQTPQDAETTIPWSATHRLLLRLWKENEAPGSMIRIGTLDLREMTSTGPARFPASFPVLFRISGAKVWIEQAGGASAGSLFGRFGLFSKEVEEILEGIACAEQETNPGVIFAEILCLSDEHADNINRRRSIREYEIPVLCRSEKARRYQVALSDLFIAVRGGELVLYCRRLKKRVIPRLTSAFNHQRNDLPIVRFLCDLQYQGLKSAFALDLQGLFPGLAYYPRVEFDDVVLFPATWVIQTNDLLKTEHANDKILLKNFWDFSLKYKLPRFFSLNERDNQLVFDSSQVADIRLLLASIPQQGSCVLKEFLFSDPGFIRDPEGRGYIGQFQAAVLNRETVYQAANLDGSPIAAKRTFMPGSSWLYLKIYCHPSLADELIAKDLRSVLRQLPPGTPWFFIRYSDPAYHIRFRIYTGNPVPQKILETIEAVFADRVNSGQVENFQADTYRRELERYPAHLISGTERFFHADSELVAAWLGRKSMQEPAERQLFFAMYTMAVLIDSFSPSPEFIVDFCQGTADAFMSEYSGVKALRVGLDRKYRSLKTKLEAFLASDTYLKQQRLNKKMNATKGAMIVLMSRAYALEPTSVKRLLGDVLHMHLNRIFVDEPRKRELTCYYFLAKYFRSQYKRSSG